MLESNVRYRTGDIGWDIGEGAHRIFIFWYIHILSATARYIQRHKKRRGHASWSKATGLAVFFAFRHQRYTEEAVFAGKGQQEHAVAFSDFDYLWPVPLLQCLW